jgi:PAS domain S-box-containing protein
MTEAALASERLTVLVVEDDPGDADLVRELLRDANLVVAGAVTPEIHQVPTLRDALAAAKERFDVALLDLGLPDATGLEGLSALSTAAPELPAVVLTGARDPTLAARAIIAGAEDFLVKGDVQGDVLLRCLRHAVARHRRASRQLGTAGRAGGVGREGIPRAPGEPRRVLVVEDNPGDAELVGIALSEGSPAFAVHHVERLAEALAWLSSNDDVDAVLLDLGLPDAAGMECVERIRAAVPALPVVVLTGSPGAGMEAVRAGVQDYVLKDELEPRDLQRAIDYAIERNAHNQRARELAAERAAHAVTQAATKVLEEANQRLAAATREAREAVEREAAARAQAERRQQEIEALFASMIDPVVVHGEDGRIASTNPAATRFFGLDVRGLTCTGAIEAAGIRFADGPMTAVSLPASRALGGETVAGERLRVSTPCGERVVLVNASPVRRGDGVRGAVTVYRDVTDQDRAEHALRENDARKNHFLAMLSHELRNPLAPIRNSVYILERAAPGGEQAHRARSIIDRQVHHLTRLVDDLLDVTRISRGKIGLQRERLDVCALARQVAEDHRTVFAEKGVELETITDPGPLHVSGDPTRIAQVIGNLLHNAAKFTPRGGRAALCVEREGEDLAALRVRDTGEGIAPAALGTVFEAFVQGDKTLDRTHGGLGLGLALVKGLAELHGGGATAQSEGLGKGSEFVVRLPLDRTSATPPRDDVSPARTAPARRILIIEDNVDAAESLKEVLELGDHVVEMAGTGLEGLEKARAFRPDVVLCDIGLPAMDGFEVASAMRADPALRSTALVALSGYAAAADLERAAEAGFDRHLAKPVDLDELERVMSAVAGLHSERSARARTPL